MSSPVFELARSAELPPNMRFGVASEMKTQPGARQNEDYSCVLPASGIAVLGDGLGGHKDGEKASRLAVPGFAYAYEYSTRQQGLDPGTAAVNALAWVRYAMTEAKVNGEMDSRAATTLSALCIDPKTGEGVIVIAGNTGIAEHVGGGVLQLLAPLQEDPNPDANGNKNTLTNTISSGIRSEGQEPDIIIPGRFSPGRRILFTDGITAGFEFNRHFLQSRERREHWPVNTADMYAQEALAAAVLMPNPQDAADTLVYTIARDIEQFPGYGDRFTMDDASALVVDYWGPYQAPSYM